MAHSHSPFHHQESSWEDLLLEALCRHFVSEDTSVYAKHRGRLAQELLAAALMSMDCVRLRSCSLFVCLSGQSS